LDGADDVSALMARLRADPLTRLGTVDVYAIDDLREGYGDLPPTDGLRLAFNGGRIIIRPSGTEPKLKCYVEVVDNTQEQARATLDAICADLRRHVAL
jgi:phosphomannomutase